MLPTKLFIFGLGFFSLACSVARADEIMEDLYRVLLSDYNKELRPSIRHDLPVNIGFSFSLIHLADLDERNQILTLNAWIHQSWKDWRLSWDPREYGLITRIHLPYDTIWTPDIILYNNAASEYLDSIIRTDVILTYDGNISLSMAGIFKSSCELDVRYYPFDFQSCLLKFASWAYDGTKIDVVLADNLGDTNTLYQVSTEWHLHSIRAEKNSIIYSCCPEPYPFIDVHLLIQRKSMFFVFNLILPCVLISLLVLLGFYMPSDSGEKVTLGITSLLSTTVFLMLVAEHLPPTADALPLIGVYYGVTILIVSLETALTVFTLNIHHTGLHGKPVPWFLQFLLFGRIAKFLMLPQEQYHSLNDHVDHFIEKMLKDQDPSLLSSLPIAKVAPILKQSNGFAFPRKCHSSEKLNQQEKKEKGWAQRSERLKRRRSSSKSTPTKRVSFTDDNDQLEHQRVITRSLPSVPMPNAQLLMASPPNGGVQYRQHSLVSDNSKASPDSKVQKPQVEGINQFMENDKMDANANLIKDNFATDFLNVLGKLNAIIERNEVRLAEKDRMDAMRLEWQMCSMVFDRFFLTLFVLGTFFTTFSIMYQGQSPFEERKHDQV